MTPRGERPQTGRQPVRVRHLIQKCAVLVPRRVDIDPVGVGNKSTVTGTQQGANLP